MEKDESYIITRILAGKTEEYAYFLDTYGQPVFSLIVRMVNSEEDAEELTQDTLMKAFEHLSSFNGKSSFSTWIYRIALNTCISFIRKEKNIPEIVTLTQEADRSEEDDETQAMLQQLYRMINRLGQLEKSIILLYLEEKSYEDISEITGLTVTNVATKLNRIKDKLKKMNKED